jgi:hypothetical protein
LSLLSLGRLDDLEAAVGGFWVRAARCKASGVCVTLSMEGAQAMLGAVLLDFQVVGNGFAVLPVAEDHFVFGVFELKTPQHVE